MPLDVPAHRGTFPLGVDDIIGADTGDTSFSGSSDMSCDLSGNNMNGSDNGGEHAQDVEDLGVVGDLRTTSAAVAAAESTSTYYDSTNIVNEDNNHADGPSDDSDYDYEDVEGIEDEDEEHGGVGVGDVEDNLMYGMINDAVRMQLQDEQQDQFQHQGQEQDQGYVGASFHHVGEWTRRGAHGGADEQNDYINSGHGDGRYEHVEREDQDGEVIHHPVQSHQEPVQQTRQNVRYFGEPAEESDAIVFSTTMEDNSQQSFSSYHSESSASTENVSNIYQTTTVRFNH